MCVNLISILSQSSEIRNCPNNHPIPNDRPVVDKVTSFGSVFDTFLVWFGSVGPFSAAQNVIIQLWRFRCYKSSNLWSLFFSVLSAISKQGSLNEWMNWMWTCWTWNHIKQRLIASSESQQLMLFGQRGRQTDLLYQQIIYCRAIEKCVWFVRF